MSGERKPASGDVLESLTGVEEQDIIDLFRDDVVMLMVKRPSTYVRALAMVLQRRGGDDRPVAHAKVMKMTAGEVNDLFDEDGTDDAGGDGGDGGDEDLPGGVESESGKDGG